MAKNENFGSVPAPVCLEDVPVMTCYYSNHRGTETFFGLHCYVFICLPSLPRFLTTVLNLKDQGKTNYEYHSSSSMSIIQVVGDVLYHFCL